MHDVDRSARPVRPRARRFAARLAALWTRRRGSVRPAAAWGVAAPAALFLTLAGTSGTQTAVANGDTRTLSFFHAHTKEEATITFRRNGYYDSEALKQLNWLLRDWRNDEPIRMDPKLFDLVWEAHRSAGSASPVRVMSAYRSPGTNAMLRRRSSGVAKHSQHMEGRALDFVLPDVSMARVREIAMRMQRGGVGFYPTAYTPFVHLDSGSVRSWPRMTRDQLARLFPDGRTVHLPAGGGAMPGYDEARAEIIARGGSVAGERGAGGDDTAVASGPRRSLWATLFGGDEAEEDVSRPTAQTRAAPRRTAPAPQYAAIATALPASGNSDDGGARDFYVRAPSAAPAPVEVAVAQPRGRRGRAQDPVPTPAPEAAAPVAQAPGAPAPVVPAAAPAPAPVAPELDETPVAGAPGSGPVVMPPRRPRDLVVPEATLVASVPMPPQRPVELASLAPIPLPAASASPFADAPTGAVTRPANGVLAFAPLPPQRSLPASPAPAAAATPAPSARDRDNLRALFEIVNAAPGPAPARPAPRKVSAAKPVTTPAPAPVLFTAAPLADAPALGAPASGATLAGLSSAAPADRFAGRAFPAAK